MTPEQKLTKQKQLVATEFLRIYGIRWPVDGTPCVYEAPAAESWVVIINGEAWVADCHDGMHDERFIFWGPLGKKAVSFPLPEEWPT